ncbi:MULTISPECIES: FkbM family methyltransferase [unclassified Xanthobacter]|uniref:FkbM family methyltransferase n=1 Tax=unclassified Xanthobacter TaxID=2623496 RepID=UPI001EDE3C9F|nr:MULTISPECIES: FkbM family methyltransferase [unclassified Xanthobacter]
MLKRIKKLLNEPAFQEAPITVLGRVASLAMLVGLGRKPLFHLVPGVKMEAPANLRYTTVSTYLLRDEVEPELKYIDKFVHTGDIFVDVGANIGLFTLKMAPRAGRIVAVEPGKEAGDLLVQNVGLNGFKNVTLVRKGLADAAGRASLFHNPVGDDPQAFSLVNDGAATEAEEVEITTLDQLVADLSLPRVDVIKIDVEGAEQRVLAGGMATISTHHPLIIFEMNCPALLSSGGDPAAPWNTLAELGYTFARLQWDGTLQPLPTRPTDFCNIVARHPSRAA